MKTLKRLFYIFVFTCVLVSCMITNPVVVFNKNRADTKVSPDTLKKHVVYLCNTPKFRNHLNVNSLDSAANYIKYNFSQSNQRVIEQQYIVDNKQYKNIISSYGPKEGKRIIVGAHYDVCGDQMGADDNASGIAGLIELSRLLAKEKNLKYRVDLVAYSLEEPPYFRGNNMGSAIHAKMCFDSGIDIKAMICLEMIGYYSEEKGSQKFPIKSLKLLYPNKGNFITVVGKIWKSNLTRHVKKNMIKGGNISVKSISAPASLVGVDFSDHRNYWKYGYKAVMITNTSFYRNNNYHKATDTPETLDYNKMSEVVKGVYYAIIKL